MYCAVPTTEIRGRQSRYLRDFFRGHFGVHAITVVDAELVNATVAAYPAPSDGPTTMFASASPAATRSS